MFWETNLPLGFDQHFSMGLSVLQGLEDAGHKQDIIWGEIFQQMEAVRAGNGKEMGWFEW